MKSKTGMQVFLIFLDVCKVRTLDKVIGGDKKKRDEFKKKRQLTQYKEGILWS